jgi:hemolysin III
MTTPPDNLHAPDRPARLIGRPRPRLRGTSHHIGFYVSIALGLYLVWRAPSIEAKVLFFVYGACATAMLGASALLHRGHWNAEQDRRLTQLDHTCIFLMIAGTYTPIAWYTLTGAIRWIVLVTAWGAAAFGIVFEWLPIRPPKGYVTAVYLTVGWVAVLMIPWLWQGLGVIPFLGVALGGMLYTLGAVIHAAQRPDPFPATFGYHEIFHALVLAAAFVQWWVIAFAILPRA